jgi:hypothetical protein
MSVRSGRKTSRYPLDVYKGFRIIKVKVIEYYRSSFSSGYTNIPEKIETHYTFCKEGEEKRPSQDYNAWADNKKECIECIDKFLADNTLYFTEEELQKYVHGPNHKNDYAFNRQSITKLFNDWKKADKRTKILYEDRLTDANFHSACSYLSECDYEGFENFVAKDCKFHEKFEIYTHTMRKAIKDPKRFEEGLAKVIADYIESQGVKDTSVDVNFIENW